MAYLRSIVRECAWQGCPGKATVELLNNRNGTMGLYCKKHGAQALRQVEARENQHG